MFKLTVLMIAAARAVAYHTVDPVFTPYYSNGTINLEVIPAYAELCVKSKVDVVLLGGSTAEWPSLTVAERLTLLSAWRSALDKIPAPSRPQLLFHSGDTSVAVAKELTAAAKSHGADSVLIVAPCIMRPATLSSLVDTIGSIAAQSDLPAIYYHYPALYGVDFKMDEFLQAGGAKIPTLAGVKYIDSDMNTFTKAAAVKRSDMSPFILYNNDPLLAGMAVGSHGAISYTTVFPLVRQMQEAFDSANLVLARNLSLRIMAYEAIVGKFGGKPAARVLPQIFDPRIIIGPPRAPLEPIGHADYEALRAELKQAGYLPHN